MVKHTQTISWQKPTNCLSMYDNLVGLALKRLNSSVERLPLISLGKVFQRRQPRNKSEFLSWQFKCAGGRCNVHCVKSVCIRSYSGPHFPVFSPNAGKCGPAYLQIRTLFTQWQFFSLNHIGKNSSEDNPT